LDYQRLDVHREGSREDTNWGERQAIENCRNVQGIYPRYYGTHGKDVARISILSRNSEPLTPGRATMFATNATDTRIGFDGLYGLIRKQLERDPARGRIFQIANARRNRLKFVFFDGSRLWVCMIRMERAGFTGRSPFRAGEARVTREGSNLSPGRC
jgi:hypothetical protein